MSTDICLSFLFFIGICRCYCEIHKYLNEDDEFTQMFDEYKRDIDTYYKNNY